MLDSNSPSKEEDIAFHTLAARTALLNLETELKILRRLGCHATVIGRHTDWWDDTKHVSVSYTTNRIY